MTRLSRTGTTTAAVGVVAGVAAWRLGWPELWGVAATCATALALAFVTTLAVPPLRARRVAPISRTTVGDDVPVRLLVTNEGRGPRRGRRALDHLGEDAFEVTLPSLAAGGEAEVAFTTRARRRGHHPWGPVEIDRGDGLGLFAVTQEVTPASTLIVHPRHHRVNVDPAGRRRDLDGLRADLAEGTITFHALREYVPGDDLRRVHWRSTARTGTMVVRQDVDPSEPRTLIIVDHDMASWSGGALEEALEVAASIAVASAAHGFPCSLVEPDDVVVDGGTDPIPVLDALAALTLGPSVPLVVPLPDGAADTAGLAVVVSGSVAVARSVADRATVAADRAILVVVEPGAETSVEAAGRSTLVIGSDAASILSVWTGASR